MTELKCQKYNRSQYNCVYFIGGIIKIVIMNIKEEATQNHLVWAGMRYCPYWPARVRQTIINFELFFEICVYSLLIQGCYGTSPIGKNSTQQNMCVVFRHQTIVSLSLIATFACFYSSVCQHLAGLLIRTK